MFYTQFNRDFFSKGTLGISTFQRWGVEETEWFENAPRKITLFYYDIFIIRNKRIFIKNLFIIYKI